MSEASERFNRRKQQYAAAIMDAIQAPKKKAEKALCTSVIIATICTIIPLQIANFFFCIITITLVTILLLLFRHTPNLKKRLITTAMIGAISITTGCSASFTQLTNIEIITTCKEATGSSCRYGTATGYALLGMPVQEATIKQAQADGGIESVFGVESVKSYGLITITRLTVYGS